jgi:hypothetical protein
MCALQKAFFGLQKSQVIFRPLKIAQNPHPVKAKRKPPHLAFLSFFFHPNPLKATVFFSPFCGFFFGQNLLTYRPQSQNLTKSPVFKS